MDNEPSGIRHRLLSGLRAAINAGHDERVGGDEDAGGDEDGREAHAEAGEGQPDSSPIPEGRTDETAISAAETDGGTGTVALSAPGDGDIDADAVTRGTDMDPGSVAVVEGQTNEREGTTVNPIASERTADLAGYLTDIIEEYDRIRDDKIQNLRKNRVDYNDLVGEWLRKHDDRIPAILNHQVALILGQDGLSVEPKNPDDAGDQRLADHLRDIYNGESDAEIHVSPEKVVRRIVAQNYQAARSVLRARDLAELPLESLTYFRDPLEGDEYYIQEPVSYKTADITEDGDFETELDTTDEQTLEIGTHVFEARLYQEEPLRSIADIVVNKLVLQRLKARKAEIASIGGIYIKVSPPPYLSENEYFDERPDPDAEGETVKKLELAFRRELDKAFSTLEGYQSGNIAAIPSHWDIQQIEIPETGEPIDDQIRGYNQDIAARLLFPLDLMELSKGSELSRDSLMQILINIISGWRGEILSVFDGFARVQADIHNIDGDVTHSFPGLESEDEKLLVTALKHAGLAGMSSREIRQVLNNIEGFDLEVEDAGGGPSPSSPSPSSPSPPSPSGEDNQQPEAPEPTGNMGEGMPPAGGPEDPEERAEQMRETLNEVQSRLSVDAAESFSEGDEVETPEGIGVVVEVRTEDFEGPDGEVTASEDNPAYVVGLKSGATVFRESELSEGKIETDIEDPESDLAGDMAAMNGGGILASVTDFDYPETWRESETPNRLILLKAWSGMNGQFDCPSGDCCKGTMMRNGMSEGAANEFCASMKDRILGYEGWRKGGSGMAPGLAAAGIGDRMGDYDSLRDAARGLRDMLQGRIPDGSGVSVEMNKSGENRFSVVVRGPDGGFLTSFAVGEEPDGEYVIVGPDKYLGPFGITNVRQLVEGEATPGVQQVNSEVEGMGIAVGPAAVIAEDPGPDDIEERYAEFRETVDLTATELDQWAEHPCANQASLNPQQVRDRVRNLLTTPKDEWGTQEYQEAGRVLNFISRMSGVDGGDPPSGDDCNISKRNISLLNWGALPEGMSEVPEA